MTSRGVSPAPILLFLGLALFLAVIAFGVISALVRPDVVSYTPSPLGGLAAPSDTLVYDTLTVDARDTDDWSFLDLARTTVVAAPDTAGWDLAFRRFSIVPAGAVSDLGPVPFDSVLEAPTEGYVPSDIGRDTTNTVLTRWYTYNILTHVLEPKPNVYVLRSRDGRFGKFQILSYYCPEATAGCVTVRFVYQPSGSTALTRE